MKKVLSLLLCVVLTVTSLVTAFAAAPKISYQISDADIKLGETVAITVSVSDYETIKSGLLALDFNQDVLEIVNGEWLISNPLMADFDTEKLNAVFAYAKATNINGDIFCFTLRAKADALSVGDMDITIKPQLKNGNGDNVATEAVITIPISVSCSEHKYGNLIPEVPAKCGVEGKKAYYKCSVCYKLFDENKNETTEAQLVIPALTHIADENWQSDADNHWKLCKHGCGTIVDGTKAAHHFEWKTDKPATEDETGLKHEECIDCGYKRSENTVIDKLDHVHTGIAHHAAVAANCHSTGTVEYWTCSSDKCAGKYYSDANCTMEITTITTPIDSSKHEGETEIRNASEATCTEDGYTGDTYCKDCGVKIADGEVISATGHTLEKVNAKEATHEAAGNIAYYQCSVCGKLFKDAEAAEEITLEDTVIAKGEHDYGTAYKSDAENHWKECDCGNVVEKEAHKFGDWTVTKEATETAKGSKERVCSVCGYKEIAEIPAIEAPSEPTESTDSEDTKSPTTGDNSNAVLWIVLMFVSASALTTIGIFAKKKHIK